MVRLNKQTCVRVSGLCGQMQCGVSEKAESKSTWRKCDQFRELLKFLPQSQPQTSIYFCAGMCVCVCHCL